MCNKKFLLIFLGALASINLYAQSLESLKEGFVNPPNESKPYIWWHWMSENISLDGIDKDLKAMKDAGLGGFHLFNVAPSRTAKGSVKYDSPQWWQAMELAGKKAEEYDLEFTYHNCAGFATTASPKVTPEYAMKQLVWTSVQVKDNNKVKIEKFTVEKNKEVPLVFTINGSQPEPHPLKEQWQNEYYTDVALIAFPTPKDELESNSEPHRLDKWQIKAGYGDTNPHYLSMFTKPDTKQAKYPIKFDEIIDLTDKLQPDGSLNWQRPDSRNWTVLRFGHTITGMQNHPAPAAGRGLECDKFSLEATDFYFENCVKPLVQRVNKDGKKRITSLLIDSYEAREQNWTPLMPQEFKKLRGYAIEKYLPAFTGRVIEDTDFTERFLFDLRKTCADMISKYHFARFGEHCKEMGLLFLLEPYGIPSTMDSIQAGLTADISMGEFWAGRTADLNDFTIKVSSSIADFKNSHIVPSESFTSSRGGNSYEDNPATFKAQGDFFLTHGVTRIVFHTFAHQPFADNMKPGMSMWGWGSQSHRNNTWWNYAYLWYKYLARSQYLLQHGKLATDFVVYYGQNNPANLLTDKEDRSNKEFKSKQFSADGFPEFPKGYDFHFCNDQLLLDFFVDSSGNVVHKNSKNSYKLLVVKEDQDMNLEILEHIASLVDAGANVLMQMPTRTSGIKDFKQNDEALKKLTAKMFKNKTGNYYKYGKGKIFEYPLQIKDVLASLEILPDFTFEFEDSKTNLLSARYIHRRIDDADLYFVANVDTKALYGDFIFRQDLANKTVEIWDAETAEILPSPLAYDYGNGRTAIKMPLEKDKSLFFVFKDAKESNQYTLKEAPAEALAYKKLDKPDEVYLKVFGNKSDLKATDASGKTKHLKNVENLEPISLDTDWTLSFPCEEGLRQNIALPKLQSWTEFDSYDEKHFSGTASYTKKFNLPEQYLDKNTGVILNLGDVSIIAQVFLNGNNLGVLWKAPFVLDVTKYLKAGQNTLLITLTNTFTNRLVGDAKLPDDNPERETFYPAWAYDSSLERPQLRRKTFFTYQYVNKNRPLVKSGLLGGVSLIPYKVLKLNKD